MEGYGQMLGAPQQMAPPAQPSAPTAAMPGGNMSQQPQDPLSFETAVIVQGLSRLAGMMQGDSDNALKVEKMALELKRIRADRQKKLAESMAAVQSAILPPML